MKRSIPSYAQPAFVEYVSAHAAKGDEDAARLLARCASAKAPPKPRPRRGPRWATKADKAKAAQERLEALSKIRVNLHLETNGTCAVCGLGLPFARMHAHHILSGPERRLEERQDTMAPLHEKCHDAVHGKDNRDPLPALDALLEWCTKTGRELAARSTQHRIAKVCEARGMEPIRVVVSGQGGRP